MREARIAIRWSDLDAYGHVYHPVFLTYLEEARDAWLRELFAVESGIWDYVVARIAIDYRGELRPEDGEAVVRCGPVRIGTSSVTTAESVSTPDGRVAAEAEVVIVARDAASGRSRPLEVSERDALERALHMCTPTQPSEAAAR